MRMVKGTKDDQVILFWEVFDPHGFIYQFSIFPIFDLSKFGMLTSKYSALAVLDINETFLVALGTFLS